ncbi:hypothetical protein Q6D67_19845 [Haliea sp. E1-2-M8]|uniref:hypothetical protein n=1 Tax=Haliea sp. E1-2-M8 TaxID=3064706 RepID=UPI00271B02CF|nr:hypothetical protein [Haliea sp. E1-2-M8]MDO8863946.1 hypothetical protein [Haliea sp. E1-2-M8]
MQFIASGFGAGAPLYLGNTADKTWDTLNPLTTSLDRQIDPGCPGALTSVNCSPTD